MRASQSLLARLLLFVLVLLVVAFAAPAAAVAQQRDGQTSSPRKAWEKYHVVFERSIFSRDRARKPAPAPSAEATPQAPAAPAEAAPPPPPPHPASHFVLIGVSHVDGASTAMFEDRRDRSIHPVRAGDVLAETKINAIAPLTVSTVIEGEPVTVQLGRTLMGTTPEPVSTSEPAAATSGGAAAGSPSSGGESAGASGEAGGADDANLSIIERMRLRRQRELQQ